MIYNVLEYLENSASLYPDKKAVADNKSSYTYTELMEKAKNAGSFLSTITETKKPVCVYMDKSCETLAVFLGIVYAGCFYVNIEPSHPAERINSIIGTLEAKILIVDDKSAKKAEKLGFEGTILNINELLNAKADDEAAYRLEYIRDNAIDIDPLYSIFTSGSTGVPKGVIVNHRSVIDFIETFTDKMGIGSDDIIGNQAPFDFDVSVKDIYSTLKCGATMQIIPKMLFSFPTKLLDYLDDNHVTTLIWAVSALCIITTLNGFDYKVPSSINKVMFSGEVMPIKHLNIWRKTYPEASFVNVYGPTEITCNCTYYKIDREFDMNEVLPIGKAFPNERVFVLDENDKLVTPDMEGVKGEICVSGTAVTMGYYSNKEKTLEAFVQNPLNNKFNEVIYRTGDLGFYNERRELCFSSRKDFQIKLNGHRIELSGLDMIINAIDNVKRVCCIFDADNERIIAFYEGDIDKKSIVHELAKKVPKFMIPGEFCQMEEMILTKNGKIDRKALMAAYKGE